MSAPKPGAPELPAAVRLKQRQQAESLREQLRSEGKWTGVIRPHLEYQTRPVQWIVDKLGIAEHTIRWSLNPEYQHCACDTVVCNARAREKRDSPAHIWDGAVDPLVQALEALARGDDFALPSGTGTGKAQPVDEPVLTPTGWRAIGDLRPGDLVIGSRGRPVEVLSVHPQGRLPTYVLEFSDGATTRASGDHLWATRNARDAHFNKPWRVLTTAEMGAQNLQKAWRVPRMAPLDRPTANLPLDPYLMGVLLGDGSFRTSAPMVSSADDEMLAAVEAALPAVQMKLGHRGHYDYTITRGLQNPVTDTLRDLGVWGARSEDKHVPHEYLWASASQRLAVLQGLMDTDGSCYRGHAEFTSASLQLADDIVFLARSLGGTARLRTSSSFFRGKQHLDRHRVSVRLPLGAPPFRLRRKAARITATTSPSRILRSVRPAGEEECVCISVDADDSLYVTKDFVVTHNTIIAAACGAMFFLACWERSIVVSIAPKQEQLLLNMWKEMGALFPRFKRHFPDATFLTGKLRMLDEEGGQEVWAATATVARVDAQEDLAQNLKGLHGAHMYWLIEEGPGNDPAIIKTITNTATGEHNPIGMLGNPESMTDELARFGRLDTTNEFRISAYDHPNIVCGRDVIPGAVSPKSVRKRLAAADGNANDPIFKAQVRGIAPEQAAQALIRKEWLEAAAARYKDPVFRLGPLAIGADPSNSEQHGRSAIARGQGACLTEIEQRVCTDASVFGAQIVEEAKRDKIDPLHVGVDAIGVGASTVNEARRQKFYLHAFFGSHADEPSIDEELRYRPREDGSDPTDPHGEVVLMAEQCYRKRDRGYWRLREDLRLGRIAIPPENHCPELWAQLLAHTWARPNGKIKVLTKELVIETLGCSPDCADAAVIWNWVRARRPEPIQEKKMAAAEAKGYDSAFDKMMAARAADYAMPTLTRRPF